VGRALPDQLPADEAGGPGDYRDRVRHAVCSPAPRRLSRQTPRQDDLER
jgi:hypothetical protein